MTDGPDAPLEARRATQRRLRRLAWWLDAAFRVPGTRFRVGLDAIVGLIPVAGDAAGLALSAYILAEAARLRVPAPVLARMAANVAVETLVGLVPFLGDLFDAAWKANERNVALLDAWIDRPAEVTRASAFRLALVVAGLGLIGVGLVALLIIGVSWLVRAI